jgi:hypothetical protein
MRHHFFDYYLNWKQLLWWKILILWNWIVGFILCLLNIATRTILSSLFSVSQNKKKKFQRLIYLKKNSLKKFRKRKDFPLNVANSVFVSGNLLLGQISTLSCEKCDFEEEKEVYRIY